MSVVPSSDTVDALQYLHARLDVHFQQLHKRRKALDPVSPVFALEHDLSPADHELLFRSVRAAIAQGMGARYLASWLPFIVYAAESGYDYVGDEYWRSFEQSTPGWRSDQRHWIKDWFRRFAAEHGGAVPSGAFAANFTIIAWPITHAVLPTYLQRQLAQLLFEFRAGLSSSLLENPDELGVRLAVRARWYSDRFRVFCQNTALLGQVAAALLAGEDSDSPYLVRSTLNRLLDGLSRERQARQWLAGAQHAAHRVRSTGFKRSAPASTLQARQVRPSAARDPVFSLRYLNRGWNANAELPNLTPLSERLPAVYDELRTLRAKVTGGRRPVPAGGLVYSGQQIRFESWPDPSKPFVQLEGGTDSANAILADQCVMTNGPWWLYRRQGLGLAVEVKRRLLRPGHSYILVGKDGTEPPAVSWSAPITLHVTGASAYQLDVPEQLTDTDVSALLALGMTVLSTVALRPVGIVASAWDGEGAAEWLAGEPAMFGVRSEYTPARCVVTVDGNPHFVPWPTGQSELILSLDGLEIGSHDVGATLLDTDDRELANGSLTIAIRDPEVRPENATIGEGIRMLASPARPTLSELWDEHATITVDGPRAANAELVVRLRDSEGAELAVTHRKLEFPIGAEEWSRYARSVRADRLFKESYDEADSCELTVRHEGIGMASLTCERGFQPLRWRFSKKHDGSTIATLQDRTDGGGTHVEFFMAEAPLTAVSCEPGEAVALPPRGGLLRATSAEAASVVLAPTNPNAVIALGKVRPAVAHGGRSKAEIMRLVEAYMLWAKAELPADPFAVHEQQLALGAIARANAVLLCGSYWAALERKLEYADEPADFLEEMQHAIGVSQRHKELAAAIGRNLHCWLRPDALLPGFAREIASVLVECGVRDRSSAARFLLTFAGRPGFILEWPASDRDYFLNCIFNSPVLLRAARFAVLGVHSLNDSNQLEWAPDDDF